jgi:hypothetical protein
MGAEPGADHRRSGDRVLVDAAARTWPTADPTTTCPARRAASASRGVIRPRDDRYAHWSWWAPWWPVEEDRRAAGAFAAQRRGDQVPTPPEGSVSWDGNSRS